MEAKIDASLKLVLERRRESDGATFLVYSQPVSLVVAREFWQVLQGAVATTYGGGNPMIAPRFAAQAVRDAAAAIGNDRVEQSFIGEIKRLTMVIVPGETGWQQIPFSDAVRAGLLSEDEADEVENAIVFFTMAWRFHSTNDRKALVSSAVTLWRGRTTSLSAMELIASLPTSNATDASGATTETGPAKTPAGSSVPS